MYGFMRPDLSTNDSNKKKKILYRKWNKEGFDINDNLEVLDEN